MIKCPFCSEEIQDSAKKCKHCGEWLIHESVNKSVEKIIINSREKYYNIGGILLGLILAIILTKMIYNAGLATGQYSNVILARRFGGDIVMLYLLYIVGYLAGRGSMKKITSNNIIKQIIKGVILGIVISGFFGIAQINGFK